MWSLAFLAVMLLPLILSEGAGGDGDLMIELSLSFGVLAASVIICTVVLPSRLRSLTAAFGIERVLKSHRYLGSLALFLVLVHLAFVLLDDPNNVRLLIPWEAPPRARAATAATVALAIMWVMAVARRRLGQRYESWRWIHVVLGMVVFGGGALHVLWLDHLVRDEYMRDWFEASLALVVLVLLYRWVWRPLIAVRNAYVIDEVRHESASVSTLALRPLRSRHRGLQFDPGQFAWIRLDSPFGTRENHPFTIASGAHRPRELEFTVRHAGDYTTMLAQLTPGRRVYIDGPHGSFTVDARRSQGLVLIAGGVGITPMMSMLRTLAHRRDEHRHVLVVGARTPKDLLFRDELASLSRRLRLTVVEVLSQPPPDWRGEAGYVDADLLARVLPRRPGSRRFDVYVCGPPPMVETAVRGLAWLGVPPQRVHTEQFDMV
jgi:predicted ferric reductase